MPARKIKCMDGQASVTLEGVGVVQRGAIVEVDEKLAEELVARGTWEAVGWKPKPAIDVLIERGLLPKDARPVKEA